jgi:hypothetical protein
MKKDNKESIKEYALRWCEAVAQVNSLLKKEMINIFSNTFKALYFEYLIESFAQYFSDLVIIAERIEQAIWLSKIANLNEEKCFTRRRKKRKLRLTMSKVATNTRKKKATKIKIPTTSKYLPLL